MGLSKCLKASISFLWSVIPPMSSIYWAFHWIRFQSEIYRNHLRGKYGLFHTIYAFLWCILAGCAGLVYGFFDGFVHAIPLARASHRENKIIDIHQYFMRNNYAVMLDNYAGISETESCMFGNLNCYLTHPKNRPHFFIRIFYFIAGFVVNLFSEFFNIPWGVIKSFWCKLKDRLHNDQHLFKRGGIILLQCCILPFSVIMSTIVAAMWTVIFMPQILVLAEISFKRGRIITHQQATWKSLTVSINPAANLLVGLQEGRILNISKRTHLCFNEIENAQQLHTILDLLNSQGFAPSIEKIIFQASGEPTFKVFLKEIDASNLKKNFQYFNNLTELTIKIRKIPTTIHLKKTIEGTQVFNQIIIKEIQNFAQLNMIFKGLMPDIIPEKGNAVSISQEVVKEEEEEDNITSSITEIILEEEGRGNLKKLPSIRSKNFKLLQKLNIHETSITNIPKEWLSLIDKAENPLIIIDRQGIGTGITQRRHNTYGALCWLLAMDRHFQKIEKTWAEGIFGNTNIRFLILSFFLPTKKYKLNLRDIRPKKFEPYTINLVREQEPSNLTTAHITNGIGDTKFVNVSRLLTPRNLPKNHASKNLPKNDATINLRKSGGLDNDTENLNPNINSNPVLLPPIPPVTNNEGIALPWNERKSIFDVNGPEAIKFIKKLSNNLNKPYLVSYSFSKPTKDSKHLEKPRSLCLYKDNYNYIVIFTQHDKQKRQISLNKIFEQNSPNSNDVKKIEGVEETKETRETREARKARKARQTAYENIKNICDLMHKYALQIRPHLGDNRTTLFLDPKGTDSSKITTFFQQKNQIENAEILWTKTHQFLKWFSLQVDQYENLTMGQEATISLANTVEPWTKHLEEKHKEIEKQKQIDTNATNKPNPSLLQLF